MKIEEIQNFFSEILGKREWIQTNGDFILKDEEVQGINYFPMSFYNLLLNKSVIRLARVLQLGTKIYVYKDSAHTRLEHSKGVYSRTLELLMNIYKDDKIKNLIQEKGYEKYLVAELARALLHDVGHGPFSHTMETVCNLPKGFHEDIGVRLINEDKELNNCLNNIYPDLPKLISEVKERNFLGLNRIFEGQIDVDRGDFVPRDCFYLNNSKNSSRVIKYTAEIFKNFYMGKIINEKGKYEIAPIFKNSQMENIEDFLERRFLNYKNIYHNTRAESYDFIFKLFAESLLKSNEKTKLKTFLQHNVNKKPEDVDLKEYIEFNDIEYLKGIFEVAKNTKDEKLRELAALSIPTPDMIVSLYYGLMVSWEQIDEEKRQANLSDEDIEFLKDLNSIKDPNSTLGKLLIQYPFDKNVFVLNSDSKIQVNELETIYSKVLNVEKDELENMGIINWKKKIASYKRKEGEEIYIEDSKGNVYEYSKHPERKRGIMECEKNGLFVLVPKLKENGISEEKISKISQIMENCNKKIAHENR